MYIQILIQICRIMICVTTAKHTPNINSITLAYRTQMSSYSIDNLTFMRLFHQGGDALYEWAKIRVTCAWPGTPLHDETFLLHGIHLTDSIESSSINNLYKT